MNHYTQGILTIAYGATKYLRMGRALALSIRHQDEEVQLAVVTDSPGALDGIYDHVIPINQSFGSGVTHKLHLDHYTPFEKTLFIDSDCLLYDHPSLLWQFFSVERGVGVRSVRQLTKGDSCQGVANFDKYLTYFDLSGIPNLKGGFYYFDDSDVANEVFRMARSIYEIREEAGLTPFKNAAVADEVVMGTALQLTGMKPLSHECAPVNTFLGQIKAIDINVLHGKSNFIKNGAIQEPVAVHYGLGTQHGYFYLRDINRLELKGTMGMEGRARMRAVWEYTQYWGKQKWDNVRSRFREMGVIGILPGRVLRQLGVEEIK